MQKEVLFIHGNIRSIIKELALIKKHILGQMNAKYSKELNAAIEIGASANRLSAHYIMKMWKVNDPTIQQHWDKGIKIYSDSVEVLKMSSFYKDKTFKDLLDKTSKSLKYFKMLATMEGFAAPSLVTMKSTKALADAKKMIKIILNTMQ